MVPQPNAAAAAKAVSQAQSVAAWAEMPHGSTSHVTRKAKGRLTRRAIQLPSRRCSSFWQRSSSSTRVGRGIVRQLTVAEVARLREVAEVPRLRARAKNVNSPEVW